MDEDEDTLHDNQENYFENEQDNLLTNDEINQINKKLQLKPPYSIIPIQYSNKELLPVHFAFDPGENYDWSKFPMQQNDATLNPKPKSKTNKHSSTSTSSSSNNSSNDSMSVSSQPYNNKSNQQMTEHSFELSRNQKMHLIRQYLDICKLELFDPSLLSSKRNNQAFNSNGMCASIFNINVVEQFYAGGEQMHASVVKAHHHNPRLATVNNKLQKFFSLFKRDDNKVNKSTKVAGVNKSGATNSTINFSTKLRKSLRNSYTPTSQSAVTSGQLKLYNFIKTWFYIRTMLTLIFSELNV